MEAQIEASCRTASFDTALRRRREIRRKAVDRHQFLTVKERYHVSPMVFIPDFRLVLLRGERRSTDHGKPHGYSAGPFCDTAGEVDIAASNVALKQTTNNSVRAFANGALRDHTAGKQQAQAFLGKLKVKAVDDEFSESIVGAAVAQRNVLSKLSGAAFDKAYIENEILYYLTVIGVLEITLIPSTKNDELKRLLESRLQPFWRENAFTRKSMI